MVEQSYLIPALSRLHLLNVHKQEIYKTTETARENDLNIIVAKPLLQLQLQ